MVYHQILNIKQLSRLVVDGLAVYETGKDLIIDQSNRNCSICGIFYLESAKMNSNSQETLRRIEQNYAGLSLLWVGNSDFDGGFISSNAGDYLTLGAAIGNNIHLTRLLMNLGANQALDIANTEFFNGLKRNSSIKNLELRCMNQLVGGVEHEIL